MDQVVSTLKPKQTMKKISLLLLSTVFIFASCGGSSSSSQTEETSEATETEETAAPAEEATPEAPASDIVDLAIATESLSTLVTAVTAAELVEVLKGEGPFTVFAPTNDAFAALPNGVLENLLDPANQLQLSNILKYHVVSGKVMSTDLSDGMTVATVYGPDITITTTEGVKVNGANVVAADIEASNGVVHVIDAVILPPAE